MSEWGSYYPVNVKRFAARPCAAFSCILISEPCPLYRELFISDVSEPGIVLSSDFQRFMTHPYYGTPQDGPWTAYEG